jgi:small-conductance mechanosensitive channel
MNTIEDHIQLFAAGATVLFAPLLGLLVSRILLSRLARLAKTTSAGADDVMVASLRRPLPLWFTLGGLYVAMHLLSVPPRVAALIGKTLIFALVLSVISWATDLIAHLFPRTVQPGGETEAPTAGVLRQAARIVVVVVGGLVLLATLGVPVTPVLTTVGIGGIAVALGLQETLANLFAGMQVTVSGNINVGDVIKLESGEEGYVDDIRWRATRIRTLPNNFVIIPNSRLARSVVTNYYRPDKNLAVYVEIGVHYSSDLEKVERVTRDVAAMIMKTVPGGAPEFEPLIRYHTFAESSINFRVALRAREYADMFVVRHEFIKAISRAYAAEGIVIPFPIRAINVAQEKAPAIAAAGA